MTDVMLSLEPADELRRLTLASSIRDETLAELERAISLERAKKAVLLEAAKAVLEWYQYMPVNRIYNPMEGEAIAKVREAIAKAEKEAV